MGGSHGRQLPALPIRLHGFRVRLSSTNAGGGRSLSRIQCDPHQRDASHRRGTRDDHRDKPGAICAGLYAGPLAGRGPVDQFNHHVLQRASSGDLPVDEGRRTRHGDLSRAKSRRAISLRGRTAQNSRGDFETSRAAIAPGTSRAQLPCPDGRGGVAQVAARVEARGRVWSGICHPRRSGGGSRHPVAFLGARVSGMEDRDHFGRFVCATRTQGVEPDERRLGGRTGEPRAVLRASQGLTAAAISQCIGRHAQCRIARHRMQARRPEPDPRGSNAVTKACFGRRLRLLRFIHQGKASPVMSSCRIPL